MESGQGALNVAAERSPGEFSGELVAGLPDNFKGIVELSADQVLRLGHVENAGQ